MCTVTLDKVEQWLKVGALAGGGAFFMWKLFTGWLIINLKVSLKLERATKSGEIDYFGITVIFEKGTTDSIWLRHVTARANWPGQEESVCLEMSEEFRWLKVQNDQIEWNQYEPSNGPIALSPGESTSVGRTIEVPWDAPITVEVAAYGKRNFWPRGFQWRASAVSLPNAKPAAKG